MRRAELFYVRSRPGKSGRDEGKVPNNIRVEAEEIEVGRITCMPVAPPDHRPASPMCP
jgi:hypothetical protein